RQRPVRGEATKELLSVAPHRRRSVFQEVRSASVPASHHNGSRRALPPLVVPTRNRKWGRDDSKRTSPSCSAMISEARRPQQQARRQITRFKRALAKRSAL